MYASLAWMLFCGVLLIIYYSLQTGDLARGDGNNSTNFQKNIMETKHMLKPCDVNLTTEECFYILKIKHCIYWHRQNLLGHRNLQITMFPQVLSTRYLPKQLLDMDQLILSMASPGEQVGIICKVLFSHNLLVKTISAYALETSLILLIISLSSQPEEKCI